MMLGTPIKDPITRKPNIDGPQSRAWAIDSAEVVKALGARSEDDASVASWIIEAPWAHPAWHSYWLYCCHLRPMPKQQSPTIFHLQGATHELWLYALNPDADRNLVFREGHPKVLTPMNFGAQFIEPDDALARLRVAAAVRRVCDGTLSPDTDYIRYWAHLFGDNMLKKGAGETRIIIGDPENPSAEIVIEPHKGPQDLN